RAPGHAGRAVLRVRQGPAGRAPEPDRRPVGARAGLRPRQSSPRTPRRRSSRTVPAAVTASAATASATKPITIHVSRPLATNVATANPVTTSRSYRTRGPGAGPRTAVPQPGGPVRPASGRRTTWRPQRTDGPP